MAEVLRTLDGAAGFGSTTVTPGVAIPDYDIEDWHKDDDRALVRLAEVAAYAAAGEVFKDDGGALVFGVRAGKFINGDTAYTYAGCTESVVDAKTNYIFLDAADLAAGDTVSLNQTGFPDPSTTPHIPLATIVAAAGAYTIDNIDNSYRERALLGMLSAATAANLNTLVAGAASNADALHEHGVAGLNPAAQDLIPTLTLTGDGSDADGTGTMTIQVKDAAGNNLAQVFLVRLWISTSEFSSPVAQNDFAAADGTLIYSHLLLGDLDVATTANGLIVMGIGAGANGTYYVMAEVDGRIYSGSVEITGN